MIGFSKETENLIVSGNAELDRAWAECQGYVGLGNPAEIVRLYLVLESARDEESMSGLLPNDVPFVASLARLALKTLVFRSMGRRMEDSSQ